jgi:Putative transmembrane protein (PGPGW)
MMDWVRSHQTILLWLAVVSVCTLALSAVLIPWMVVRIPRDYFTHGRHHAMPWSDRHPIVRLALIVGKNLLGVFFVLIGIAMLVLPGQGILTILAGVMLLDFPGRHRLVCWFVARRAVLSSLNWVRRRAGRPELIVDTPS